MVRSSGAGPLLRAVLIVGVIGVMTTAATYAALQSPPAYLTNNSIETTAADLRINKDGSSLTTTITGFDFKDVTPGGAAFPADGNTFYLKNLGSANLGLRAAVTTTPTIVTQPNGATVNLSQVYFIFTRLDNQTVTSLTLQALMDGNASGGVMLNDTLNAQTTAQYNLRVQVGSSAFTAQSAAIQGINLAFSGVAV